MKQNPYRGKTASETLPIQQHKGKTAKMKQNPYRGKTASETFPIQRKKKDKEKKKEKKKKKKKNETPGDVKVNCLTQFTIRKA